ncbi:MAG: cytochrome c oxidase assembly protein [Muricomes sp.]
MTGYAGTINRAEAPPEERARTAVVTMHFDANIARRECRSSFRPEARTIEAVLGETGLAFYEMENLSRRAHRCDSELQRTPFRPVPSRQDCLVCFQFQELSLGSG